MIAHDDGLLVLLPMLTAKRLRDGRVRLTAKFLDGVLAYAQHWHGPIRVLLETREAEDQNLDDVDVAPAELPFALELVDFAKAGLRERLSGAALVFGSASHRQVHLAALCRDLGIPCVIGTEYTLRTRLQILGAGGRPDMRRLRSALWTIAEEVRERRMIRAATAVQCNGTPTYDLYRRIQPRAHLYFDTRTRAVDVVEPAALERRLATLLSGAPLRLVYSGRLDRIKGTQYLAPFAAQLRARGVPFQLDICGGGPLEAAMASDIRRLDLGAQVRLRGVLDFQNQLLPFVRASADLFICPHVQGDPSCTYLETLACGVPIAGFANEAFVGLSKRVESCWSVPIRAVAELADKVAQLDRDRNRIAAASRGAREFAQLHTFEATFERRVAHLRSCARPAALQPQVAGGSGSSQ